MVGSSEFWGHDPELRTGYAAMSLLALLVIGLMSGLVYWGVRVTRR